MKQLENLEDSISKYQFNIFADTLLRFLFWHDVCDRYLEAVKPSIDNDPDQQTVLANLLNSVLRIMPQFALSSQKPYGPTFVRPQNLM